MRVVLVMAIAAVSAALVLTSASAGPPPPIFVTISAAHAHPAPGREFTGLTIAAIYPTVISQVYCDATILGVTLHARRQKFYNQGGSQSEPLAVTCSWKIPRSARGWLKVADGGMVWTSSGEHGIGAAWRIKTR